jgi:protein tyrosine phosphatase (PTP) superfamily phosphohydrolase (DUF442 family)
MQFADEAAMPKHLAILLLLAVPLSCQLVGGDDGEADPAGQSVRSSDLGQMHCVSVDGEAWIGSYPTPQDLDLARRRGIRVAIDFSAPDESADYDVAGACRKLGIEYVALDIESKSSIGDERVDRVLEELRRRGREPMLLFCADSSRAAMLFAIHRAVDDALPIEQALVEARRAGMKPGRPEAFVRAQVARLKPRG